MPFCSFPCPSYAGLQVISDVLAEYGDNIDAAIKHLTDLRLSTASTSAAAAGGSTPQQQQQQQQAVTAAQQQQQQQAGAAAAAAAAAAGAEGAAAANGRPKSADEWVDLVVREMAAAADMADARARASKTLQAFEQAAVEHSKQAATQQQQQVGKHSVGRALFRSWVLHAVCGPFACPPACLHDRMRPAGAALGCMAAVPGAPWYCVHQTCCSCCALVLHGKLTWPAAPPTTAQGGESERVGAQLADVLRENQLLKRAVAIQNNRIQELR